jgi:hypothetical protein
MSRAESTAEQYARICAEDDARRAAEEPRRPRRRLPPWAKTRSRPRDPVTGFLKPRRCQMYLPGHSVHWIQARKSEPGPFEVGILTEVNGDVITLEFGTEYRRYRNHEVERLVEIVGIDNGVHVSERYRILRSRTGYLFSIATVGDRSVSCDATPLATVTPEALAERLETHGGFSIPGRQLTLTESDAGQ